MTPMLSFRMREALLAGAIPVLFAEVGHPDGTGYFWTGVGTIDWNGHTWTGAGSLGGVAPIEFSTDLSLRDIVFAVRGVSPDDAARLGSDVTGLAGNVWLGCIANGRVVADPVHVVESTLDYQSYETAEDGTISLGVVAKGGFYTLMRALNRVWSSADHKRTYAADTGLDLIETLQNKELQWTQT